MSTRYSFRGKFGTLFTAEDHSLQKIVATLPQERKSVRPEVAYAQWAAEVSELQHDHRYKCQRYFPLDNFPGYDNLDFEIVFQG